MECIDPKNSVLFVDTDEIDGGNVEISTNRARGSGAKANAMARAATSATTVAAAIVATAAGAGGTAFKAAIGFDN